MLRLLVFVPSLVVSPSTFALSHSSTPAVSVWLDCTPRRRYKTPSLVNSSFASCRFTLSPSNSRTRISSMISLQRSWIRSIVLFIWWWSSQALSPRFLSWVVQALCFSVSHSSGRMLRPVVNCIGLYVLVPSFKTLYLIDTLHTIGYLLLSFILNNRNAIRGIIVLRSYF